MNRPGCGNQSSRGDHTFSHPPVRISLLRHTTATHVRLARQGQLALRLRTTNVVASMPPRGHRKIMKNSISC